MIFSCESRTSDKSETEVTDSKAYSFPRPDQYDPLTFINAVSRRIPADSGSFISMAMVNEFPQEWVKPEHLEKLFAIIDSRDTCGCFVNPLSSFLPTGYAEQGGYAAIFIKSFKEKKRVDFGLYSCPKVDARLNKELIDWWTKASGK